VLVQREMECGHSPLVRIARVSVGRGAADRNGAGTRKDGNCNWLQKEIRGPRCASGSPDTDIVALRPGGGLGLTAETHARTEGQLPRKKEP
jgi:hypothetical protein